VAILRDHNTVLTVSSLTNDYHGISDVCLSVGTIVNRTGVREVLRLEVEPTEVEMLRKSADVLKASMQLSNLK
jgi:L-lactate dehydrogenase